MRPLLLLGKGLRAPDTGRAPDNAAAIAAVSLAVILWLLGLLELRLKLWLLNLLRLMLDNGPCDLRRAGNPPGVALGKIGLTVHAALGHAVLLAQTRRSFPRWAGIKE